MTTPLLLYITVIIAYIPGIILLFISKKIHKFPILVFAFFGMLAFNALGSISTFSSSSIYRINFDKYAVSDQLALILIVQIIIYYIFAAPYIIYRNPPARLAKLTLTDLLLVLVGIVIITALGIKYFLETDGYLLLFSTLDGSLDINNSFSTRMKYIYGLKNWPIYNIGFVFLPIVIFSYALLIYRFNRAYWPYFLLAAIICFSASLSMGSKAGLISFVLSSGITLIVHMGSDNKKLLTLVKNKVLIIFLLVGFFLLALGYLWTTPDDLTIQSLLTRIWYRMFVAYPDTIAGAISYVQENGVLGVSMLPTIRGLLPHEQINISLELHQFIAGSPGGATLPYGSEAFLIAGWIGIAVACPIVVLTLIFLQETTFHLKIGLTSLAFSSLFSYLAVLLSTIGVFSTFFNLMYPGTLLIFAIIAVITEHFRNLLIGYGR